MPVEIPRQDCDYIGNQSAYSAITDATSIMPMMRALTVSDRSGQVASNSVQSRSFALLLLCLLPAFGFESTQALGLLLLTDLPIGPSIRSLRVRVPSPSLAQGLAFDRGALFSFATNQGLARIDAILRFTQTVQHNHPKNLDVRFPVV